MTSTVTARTGANLDESIVLDEDGVCGEVTMDHRRLTAVQVAAVKTHPYRTHIRHISLQ